MYIALTKKRGQPLYILRQSCLIDKQLTYKNIFVVGPDPSKLIKYPGGNAFYFDEDMVDAISESGVDYYDDELEEIFWPWVDPEIRRAVNTFRNRSYRVVKKKLSSREKEYIAYHVHSFDKRRAHFLKFGNMDQGAVENMPASLFRGFLHKSRDEIEQNFLQQESLLKAREHKSYLYTVFNLQIFFQGFMAKKMPHALDQDKVDKYFIKELCRLNQDLFNKKTDLDNFFIRYAIMFFDSQYAGTTLLDGFARQFMNRHRFFKPKAQKSISIAKACRIFNITDKERMSMTKKSLTKKYRRLARQVHPDAGGSHEKFVELNNAYQSLLSRI